MLGVAHRFKLDALFFEVSRSRSYAQSAYVRTGTGFSADQQIEHVRLMPLLYVALCFMEFWDIL